MTKRIIGKRAAASTPAVKASDSVKARRTASAVFSQGARLGLKQINQMLRANPEITPSCLLMLQGNLVQSPSAKRPMDKQLGPETPWPDAYTQIENIPRYWLAAFLQQVNPKFDDSRLEKITRVDGTGVRKLVHLSCGLDDHAALPPSCHDKYICSLWFRKLYELHGSRLADKRPETYVEDDGRINWTAGGCYRLAAYEGGVCLCHAETNNPVKVPFDDASVEAQINFNWSDSSAEIDDSYGMKCVKLFKNEGQALIARDTKASRKVLADAIVKEVEAEKAKKTAASISVGDGVAKVFQPKTPNTRRRRPVGDAPPMSVLQDNAR